MAQIVAGFGVPHTPIFPHFVKRDGPDCEIAKLFGAQKAQLAATRPDLIVMFDTDHLNTFFLDNLPIFAVGIDKSFKAPNDEPRDVPNYIVPSIPDVAARKARFHLEHFLALDVQRAGQRVDLALRQGRAVRVDEIGNPVG